MNEEEILALQVDNDTLRVVLGAVLQHLMEDVPAEMMGKHLLEAIAEAQDLLADLGDIDHNEENL